MGPPLADLPDLDRRPTPAFWVIAGLGVVVDAAAVRHASARGRSAIVYPSIAFTFALLLGWGLGPAVVVQAAAVVVSSIRLRHAPWRAVFNIGQYALSFAAADAGADAHRCPAPGRSDGRRLGRRRASWPCCRTWRPRCVWFVVNELLVLTAVWLRFGGSLAAHADPDACVRTCSPRCRLLALGPLIVAAGNVERAAGAAHPGAAVRGQRPGPVTRPRSSARRCATS